MNNTELPQLPGCAHEDLFERCANPATATIQWRWWGTKHYCAQHLPQYTQKQPPDLMKEEPLTP